MYGVELYAAVRLAVVDEGLSHHEAGRRFGIDRRTVKKMLSYSAPPPRSPTGAKQTRTIVKARHCKKSSAQVRSRLTADPFDLRNTGRKPRVHILSLIDFFELNQ